MRKAITPVPVLMYHSVRPSSMINSPLSVPYEVFTQHMQALAAGGYITVTLQEVHDYIAGRISLPRKAIALTFDDGFLDNWIYVYPLLKRLSLKATIFPTVDFIGEGPPRQFYSQENRSQGLSLPACEGSLRWSELIEMESSGVFDVQSHTMTHTWLFKSDKIVDYVNSEPKYHWLSWNYDPEGKPNLLEESGTPSVPIGYPVFENDRALRVRQFFPDEDFVNMLLASVEDMGGSEFFKNADWEKRLKGLVEDWKREGKPVGRYETDSELSRRIKYELVQSRKILSEKLQKDVRFLCWPGGARTPQTLEESYSAGYVATTYPSAEKGRNKNIPGEDSKGISRIGACASWRVKGSKNARVWLGPVFFKASIMAYKGSIIAKLLRKGIIAYIMGKYYIQQRTSAGRHFG